MDNPKKKKLDSKRVAISQKHELDYCRRIAKDFSTISPRIKRIELYAPQAVRLAKAFLKVCDVLRSAKLSERTNLSIIKNLRKRVAEHDKRIKQLELKLKSPYHSTE